MEFQSQRHWQVYDPAGRRKYANAPERIRLLAAADSRRADLRALAYVLTFTGCRVSEALALTADHFDVEANTVTFRTLKRRRPSFRAVPIPPELIGMVMALGTMPGKRIWPIHRVTAWRQIKALCAEAQMIGPMACCRGLRHGFGIRAATRSVPANLIQRWLGHAYPWTTAIYLDAVDDEERHFAERMW